MPKLAINPSDYQYKMNFSIIREKTLKYIETMRIKGRPYGQYCCHSSYRYPVLYASCYAAMTRHLYSDLKNITEKERLGWIAYLQSYQEKDGLFADPVCIDSEFWKDKKWNNYGQFHFTLHIIGALCSLGAIIQRPFKIIEPFKEKEYTLDWLEKRNWEDWHTGNEVQDLMVLLQYARDFHKDREAGESAEWIFDYLDKRQNPGTGLWGEETDTPEDLSRQVQGCCYHFLLLYFYDKRKINYKERIIDSCLATQNKAGGFGISLNSNACEDIDSIDPLARLSFFTSYRKADIKQALKEALPWVLSNQNEDGGFVFSRGDVCECGTSNIYSDPDESTMFATWFRTLSLAYIGKAFPELITGVNWNFMNCPGHQFWINGEDKNKK